MYVRFAALLIFAGFVSAQTASVWSAGDLATKAPGTLHAGPGYSIALRSIGANESHGAGGRADHMLWIRGGSLHVGTAAETTEAGPGDIVRIPAGRAWSIRPAGRRAVFVDVSIDPLAPGRAAPEGIRPAPGKMGIRVSKAGIGEIIARTEANAPLHSQDNFTANFVLFKGRVGPWESHANCTDIYLVQTGAGVIQTGGTIVNAKDASPGEPRGTAITGSRDFAVAGGDLLVIPRKAAHHMNPKTLPLAYVLIKVWSE